MRRLTDRLAAARRDDRGFTLIELLIVIVILGVLAAIVVFSVRGITDDSETSACKIEVRTVTTAIEAWAADPVLPAAGPATVQDLVDEDLLADAPDGASNITAATAITNFEMPAAATACP